MVSPRSRCILLLNKTTKMVTKSGKITTIRILHSTATMLSNKVEVCQKNIFFFKNKTNFFRCLASISLGVANSLCVNKTVINMCNMLREYINTTTIRTATKIRLKLNFNLKRDKFQHL